MIEVLIVAFVLVVVAAVAAGSVLIRFDRLSLPVRETIGTVASALWVVPPLLLLVWLTHNGLEQLERGPNPAPAPVVNPFQRTVPAPPPAFDAADAELISTSDLPDWVSPGKEQASLTPVSHSVLSVLSSKQHATVELAEDEVMRLAVERVARDFQLAHGEYGTWQPPASLVRKHAVRRTFVETVERDFGSFTAPMHRAHVQLELSPDVHDKLYPVYRQQVVTRRTGILGSLLGMVTLMLGAVAGYFRLDQLTGGAHRRRLKLAALSLVGAGGVIVAAVMHRF